MWSGDIQHIQVDHISIEMHLLFVILWSKTCDREIYITSIICLQSTLKFDSSVKGVTIIQFGCTLNREAASKNQFWVQEALHNWVSKHLSRPNLFEYESNMLFSLFTCPWQSDSLGVLNSIINHLLQIYAYWKKKIKIPQMDKNGLDAKIPWMDKNSSQF